MHERRKYPRAYTAAIVSLFRSETHLGDYLAQNLSASGALLMGGPPVAVGSKLRARLGILGGELLEVAAVVARHVELGDGLTSVAIMFRYTDPDIDRVLQASVLKALSRKAEPSVLVVHRSPSVLAEQGQAVLAVGGRPVLAFALPEARRRLCEPDLQVDTILVDATLTQEDAMFIPWVHETLPQVRCIVVHDHTSASELARALARKAP